MTVITDSLVVRLLTWLAKAVIRWPRRFLFPQFVLFGLCVWVTVDRLQFDMDRNNLVGNNQRYHRAFLEYMAQFSAGTDLVTLVESEDMEKNRQFVERLGNRLEAHAEIFTNVFYKGDLKMMGPKALLLVTNDTMLVEMSQRLTDAKPMLKMVSQVTNLVSLFKLINREFRGASQEASPETDRLLQTLPALTRIITLAADALERPGVPVSPGVATLFDSAAEAEAGLYITFASNRIYLVTAQVANPQDAGTAVDLLRRLVDETRGEVPGVNAGITGEPVLEVDEMAQAQKDSTNATVVSLVICALIFIAAYKETGRPLKAVVCLVIGLGYTLGFTTVTVGHLNLLTVTFLPILIGLAIDFGVHLVTRYEEEVRGGHGEEAALTKAMVNTGQGIFTGCFTTAGAFLAMGLTDFKGIKEMGLISGAGLIICLIPMMTILPVLLLRGRQNVIDHRPHTDIDRRARIERLWLERPGLVASLTLVVTAVAVAQFPRVYFDYNLLNLQTKGLQAVEYEHKLINSASKSVIFGVVIADSPQEATALESRLVALPSVASIDSMAHYLSGDQTSKLRLIGEIKAKLERIEFPPPDTALVDMPALRLALQTLTAYLKLGEKGAGNEGEPAIAAELDQVRQATYRLRQRMTDGDPALVARKLAAFQQALFIDLHGTFDAIRDQDDSSPLSVQDLPASLRNRFVSRSGTNYLLQVNPKRDVWQRDNQEAFVRDLRAVDPDATGAPVQLLEYTTLLKDSYVEAALYALGAIIVLVFIHFRSLPGVALALLPVAVGTAWAVGWMGWWGVPFNPANIMMLPLVVGVGVTNGIHILNRFAEEKNPGILAKSTGKAVLVSGLTTVTGFGSLIPAQHQGISSLGMVMAVATTTCMVAALTFLPALLNWLSLRGWELQKKKPNGGNAQPPLGSGGTEALN